MVSNKLIKIDTSPILLWPYNENKTYIFLQIAWTLV